MAKILIVEDDFAIASQIKTWLELENYSVEHAHDARTALEFLAAYDYQAIILDWQLPDSTGIEILKKLRSKGDRKPVLMLTALGEISQKETGFDAGADDYLTKPFEPRELSARLRSLLRRAAGSAEHVLKVGKLSLEPSTRHVTNNGKTINLQPKEFALLEFLMSNPNKVFSGEAIINKVWPADSEATGNVVRSYIYTLRKKIADENSGCSIQTLHGVGYKLETVE